MTYLVLMQQKFSPGTGSCHSARTVYYGDPLYLSIDLTHFVYRETTYYVKFNRIDEERGVHQSTARSGRKWPANVDFRKYIYDIGIPEKLYLTIVQIKDVNIYLHNRYEFTYITFAGMRFEIVFFGGSANF